MFIPYELIHAPYESFGWNFTTIGQLSMIISALIFVSCGIAAGLYKKAYYQMKKTPIILSVCLLFYSMTLKFLVTSTGYFMIFSHFPNFNIYTFSAINSLSNILILLAIMNFIHQSIKTPNKTKDCLKAINNKDIRKL